MEGSNGKRILNLEKVMTPDGEPLELRNSKGETYFRQEILPGKGWTVTLCEPLKRDGTEYVYSGAHLVKIYEDISLLDWKEGE